MENASKALLIAGAILIVILLIAVGMMVYRGAQGSINKAIGQMSSTEKDIHNSQFEPYIGSNKSGSEMRTLCSKVISNNSNSDNIKVKLTKITKNGADLTFGDTTENENELSSSMSAINTGASYKYNIEAIYSSGVITEIKVTKQQ